MLVAEATKATKAVRYRSLIIIIIIIIIIIL